MSEITAGDLVRTIDADHEMLVVGRADSDFWEPCMELAFSMHGNK